MIQDGSVKVTATGSVTDTPVDKNLTNNPDDSKVEVPPTTKDEQKQEQAGVPKSGPK